VVDKGFKEYCTGVSDEMDGRKYEEEVKNLWS
jgi:hypothetical protein